MSLESILKISIPGKVFLAGEYLALQGGLSLTAALKPMFELSITQDNLKQTTKNPFHPESPAGKFWLKHQDIFNNFNLEWIDPLCGKGGVGGSTAEFALLNAFFQMKDSLATMSQPQFDLHQMLREYRELANPKGIKPSGADLVGQFQGGLTLFSRDQGKLARFGWLFSDLGFYLVRTGVKVKTHEHLESLQPFDASQLEKGMDLIQKALPEYRRDQFVEGLKVFSQALKHLNLVCRSTQILLDQINHPDVLVKKGCGALGADVLLVVFDQVNLSTEPIKLMLEKLNLEIIGSHLTVCYQGIQSQVLPNHKSKEKDTLEI